MECTSAPCRVQLLAPRGSAMAQPTPPPTTATFFRPSVCVALAQRADEILNIFAFCFRRSAPSVVRADDLENDSPRYQPRGRNPAMVSGMRSPSSSDAQDDELAGLRLARDHRRFNDQHA